MRPCWSIIAPMGSVWLGLIGAIIGGLVSLIGTLTTSRLQWRQEIARWSEERERNAIQWKQQIESDARKTESERRRDELSWERSRQDEKLRWLREQRLKWLFEVTNQNVSFWRFRLFVLK